MKTFIVSKEDAINRLEDYTNMLEYIADSIYYGPNEINKKQLNCVLQRVTLLQLETIMYLKEHEKHL